MSKNILVTGGLGAVGTYLVRELRGRGHQVFVADLRTTTRTLPTRAATSASSARSSDSGPVAAGSPATPPQVGPSTSSTTWQPSSVAGTARTTTRRSGAPTPSAPRTSSGCRRARASRPSTSRRRRSTATSTASWPRTSWTSIEVRQMNDYALSKWVNEQQIMNSATAVRHQVGACAALQHLWSRRAATARTARSSASSAYRALHDIPFTVYRGYKRTSTYIDDMARTLANISRQVQRRRGLQHRRRRLPHHRGRRGDHPAAHRQARRGPRHLQGRRDPHHPPEAGRLLQGAARPGPPDHRDARGRDRPHAGLDASAVRRLTMASPHVLTVFGTRPEAVKMAPVLQALATSDVVEHRVLHGAARHAGPAGDALVRHHARHRPAVMRAGQSLAQLTARLYQELDSVLTDTKPDLVLVHGDTTSAMVAATCAFYRRSASGTSRPGCARATCSSRSPRR